jgi:hypothetical protein
MTIEEVFKNRELIIAKKKNAIKHADVVINQYKEDSSKTETSFKAGVDLSENNNPTVLTAKLVINTTNIIDSHMDCHIPGLWKKTLSETKVLYLLQEHDMEFDKIIADSVNDGLKAYTKNVSWSSLGYSFSGNTEALVFETQLKSDVNAFMFEMYKKGRVLNHSVGMRYSKIYLCINSSEPTYSAEKDAWDKYYPAVANKELADEKGYFWAVTEAKVIEGSAVVKGSNEATPVMEIEIDKNIEAVGDTSKNEPSKDTQNVNYTHLFI